MPAIHYLVRINLIRYKKDSGEFDFVNVEEKFEDEIPIKARDRAFDFYQNYIDVFLESKNIKYESDKQAREDIDSFIDPGTSSKFQFDGQEFELSDSFGNGIGVFMVIDSPIENSNKIGEECSIHGIGTLINGNFDTDYLIFSLETEYEYYNHFGYDTDNRVIDVLYFNSAEWAERNVLIKKHGYGDWLESYNEPNHHKILKTPFDWTGYDKEYWWSEPNDESEEEIEEYETKEKSKIFEELINNGESNYVEFKPALLYNFSTGRAGIGVKAIIAKTICAFLNSNGGYLFIGVSDNGEINGVSHDFSLSQGKNEKDFFKLEFDQMIEHFLSFSVKNNIIGEFRDIKEKDVFVVKVFPNKRRPIFLNGQNGKEFYIRGEASSRQLNDPEDLVNYCIDKWGNI